MANRFWVGGTGNWDTTNTTNWSTTSGGSGGASVPTSADSVIFDTLSNATAYTVTVTSTANCLDLTIGNPLVGAITFAGSGALNVYGNFSLASGMIMTYNGAMTMRATSTGKTITTNGIALANSLTFNGSGGGWTLQDNFTTTGATLTLTNGTLDANGKTVSIVELNLGAGTKTLTLGASSFTCTGIVNLLNNTTNFTLNANTSSVISNSGGTGQNDFGGKTWNNVTVLGTTGIAQVHGANTFANLILTGGANKTGYFRFNGNNVISGTLTVNGNSITNRVILDSSVKGTARTLTAGTVIVTNADFQDIIGAGTGSWNLSGVSGGSGDCGGNSGITFTTSATTNCSAGTTWSTATWSSRVPLPQDTATFSGSSRTITQDMPRIGAVDFTGSSGLTWTTSTACSFFGSINLTNLGTLTASVQGYTYEGRGNSTLTSAGKTWAKTLIINCIGGKLTLQDSTILTAGSSLTHTSGELDTNNQSLSVGFFNSSSGISRTLTLGSSIISITNTGGGISIDATSLTVSSNTATIKFIGTLTSTATFTTNVNFNGTTLWNATTGAFYLVMNGTCTFGTIKIDASRLMKFTNGTTTTATTWDIGSGCTFTSSSFSPSYTLAKAGGGTVSAPNITVSYSTASPTSTFYATGTSTNGGNNTNWTFGEIPVSGTFIPRITFF